MSVVACGKSQVPVAQIHSPASDKVVMSATWPLDIMTCRVAPCRVGVASSYVCRVASLCDVTRCVARLVATCCAASCRVVPRLSRVVPRFVASRRITLCRDVTRCVARLVATCCRTSCRNVTTQMNFAATPRWPGRRGGRGGEYNTSFMTDNKCIYSMT